MAVVERRAEFIRAWVAVIAICSDVTAPCDLRVYALIGVRLTDRLRARLPIIAALLGREATAGDREVVADLWPNRAAVRRAGVPIITWVSGAGAEVGIRRVLAEVHLHIAEIQRGR